MDYIKDRFRYGKQHDAHQFLIYMVDHFEKNNISMEDLYGEIKRTTTCQKCQNTFTRKDKALEIFIDKRNSLKEINNFQELIEEYKC